MSRVMTCAAIAVFLAALAVGCNSYNVPADQRLMVQIKEISEENPVKVVMTVDGQDPPRFTGEISPGKEYRLLLHDPDPAGKFKLSAGEKHRIWWEIHRNNHLGKVGNGEVTVWSGNEALITTNSTWIMPLFKWQWSIDVTLGEPTAAPSAEPAPMAPKSGPPTAGPTMPEEEE